MIRKLIAFVRDALRSPDAEEAAMWKGLWEAATKTAENWRAIALAPRPCVHCKKIIEHPRYMPKTQKVQVACDRCVLDIITRVDKEGEYYLRLRRALLRERLLTRIVNRYAQARTCGDLDELRRLGSEVDRLELQRDLLLFMETPVFLPNDVDLNLGLCNAFGKAELEQTMGRIVRFCQVAGNRWHVVWPSDLKNLPGEVEGLPKDYWLKELARLGHLAQEGDSFRITMKGFERLVPHVRKETP